MTYCGNWLSLAALCSINLKIKEAHSETDERVADPEEDTEKTPVFWVLEVIMKFMLEKARRRLKGVEVTMRSTSCSNGRQGVRDLEQGELWAKNGVLRGKTIDYRHEGVPDGSERCRSAAVFMDNPS